MKNSILAALLGLAVLAAVPASADTSTFDFMDCGSSGNPACSSNVSNPGYAVTANGNTATATAYYFSGSLTNSSALNAGELGAYGSAGLGVCETQSFGNCSSPTHQINNGANPSGTNGKTTQDFEFVLIHFTTAVNLSQIQLGNFGAGASNPFDATYFVSSNSSLGTSINGMTYSQLTGGTDGFAQAQTSCGNGTTLLESAQGRSASNCDTEAMDSLGGTDVSYLLIGASTNSSEIGQDYFKIQGLSYSSSTTTTDATPEPATFGLLGSALFGLGFFTRKRKRS